jgi:four helix bundle protein
MQKSKGFRELLVWQKAHHCALEVYKLTRTFPIEELFVLTSQIRRSSISVAANTIENAQNLTKLSL